MQSHITEQEQRSLPSQSTLSGSMDRLQQLIGTLDVLASVQIPRHKLLAIKLQADNFLSLLGLNRIARVENMKKELENALIYLQGIQVLVSRDKSKETNESVAALFKKRNLDFAGFVRKFVLIRTEGAQENLYQLGKEYTKNFAMLLEDVAGKINIVNLTEVPVQEALRMQLYAALHIRAILVNSAMTIAEKFKKNPEHVQKFKAHGLFYPPFKIIYGLMNYIPPQAIIASSTFLQNKKNEFQNFLKSKVNIKKVVKEILGELPKQEMNEVIALINEGRSSIIAYSEQYFQLTEALAESYDTKKIGMLNQALLLQFVTDVRQHPDYEKLGNIGKLTAEMELSLVLKSINNPNFLLQQDESTYLETCFSALSIKDIFTGNFNLDIQKVSASKDEKKEDAPQSIPLINTPESNNKKKKAKKKKKKSQQHDPVSRNATNEALSVELPKQTTLDSAAVSSESKTTESVLNNEQQKIPDKTIAASVSSGMQFFQVEDQTFARLKEIVNYALGENESKLDQKTQQIALSMHVNAIFFAVIECMEKRKNNINKEMATQARYVRNALVHCKGLINEATLTSNAKDQLSVFHRDVVEFGKKIVKEIENPDASDLSSDEFYRKVYQHGQSLDLQLARGERQAVTVRDKMHYTQFLGLQWVQYNIPQQLPISEEIYNNANKMLIDKLMLYSNFYFNPHTVRLLAEERHGKKDSTPHLPTIGLRVSRQT